MSRLVAQGRLFTPLPFVRRGYPHGERNDDDNGIVTWLALDLDDGHVEETVANEPRFVPAQP
jgi:hypothetical protein